MLGDFLVVLGDFLLGDFLAVLDDSLVVLGCFLLGDSWSRCVIFSSCWGAGFDNLLLSPKNCVDLESFSFVFLLVVAV